MVNLSMLSRTGLRRLLRPGAQLPWVLTWGATLLGIELFGRAASSDVVDAVSVMAVFSLYLMTRLRHARTPLSLLEVAHAHARRWLPATERWWIRTGLDLRGSPPIPERVPSLLWVPFCVLLLTLGVLVLGRGVFPVDARAAVMRVSCVVYILALTGLWILLIGGLVLSFTLPLLSIGALSRRQGQSDLQRRRLVSSCSFVYLCLLASLSWMLPTWAPIALLMLLLITDLGLSACRIGKTPQVLWRRVKRPAPLALMRWSTLAGGLQIAAVVSCLCLVLISRGDSLLKSHATEMPITSFLGLALSWTAIGAYLVQLSTATGALGWSWGRDPARPLRARVHVEGPLSPSSRRRVRAALMGAGLRAILAPRERRSTDVPIEIQHVPGVSMADAGWPRAMSLDELERTEVIDLIRERSKRLCRRALRSGLERMLQVAAAREYEAGGGFLIAPQLWIVTHLMRDAIEGDAGRLGTSYAKEIPAAARHHAHVVLEALEIDLIFLEDGLKFAPLRRAMARIFELYDEHGGERRAEEQDFSRLSGIRILIVDYVVDEPSKLGEYPEPKYESLGRARILHIFRDRGGKGRDKLLPWESNWVSGPMAFMPG